MMNLIDFKKEFLMSNNKIIINDDEYKKFLIELKEKVKNSQLKAAVKVNYELLDLYWNLGKKITEKQAKFSWGEAFISNLSKDLKNEFPNTKFKKYQILVSFLFKIFNWLTSCKPIKKYKRKNKKYSLVT